MVDDATGGLRLHRRFDSFGNIVDETHYGSNEYGYHYTAGASDPDYVDLAFAYTGRMLDKATGLQNNLNRWYDASVGRWLSEDPIGFNAGDANLYRYVGNGPTNGTDPSGLFWGTIGGAVIGGIAGWWFDKDGGWNGAISGAIGGAIAGTVGPWVAGGISGAIGGGATGGVVGGAVGGAIGGGASAAVGETRDVFFGDGDFDVGAVGLGVAGGALSGGVAGLGEGAMGPFEEFCYGVTIEIWSQNFQNW